MSWFQRLFGGKEPSVPSGVPVEPILSAAGWQPGRKSDVSKVEASLHQAGFHLHDAARQFLTEFGGLALHVPIAGVDGITGFVHFDPEKVLRFLDVTYLGFQPSRPGDLSGWDASSHDVCLSG